MKTWNLFLLALRCCCFFFFGISATISRHILDFLWYTISSVIGYENQEHQPFIKQQQNHNNERIMKSELNFLLWLCFVAFGSLSLDIVLYIHIYSKFRIWLIKPHMDAMKYATFFTGTSTKCCYHRTTAPPMQKKKEDKEEEFKRRPTAGATKKKQNQWVVRSYVC